MVKNILKMIKNISLLEISIFTFICSFIGMIVFIIFFVITDIKLGDPIEVLGFDILWVIILSMIIWILNTTVIVSIIKLFKNRYKDVK